MIQYLLEVSLCWLAFYGLYFLLLQKQTFFGLNRLYLLGSFLISLVLPVLEFDAFTLSADAPIQVNYLEPITITAQQIEYSLQEIVVTPENGSNWSLSEIILGFYLAGVALFGIRFLMGIVYLYHLSYSGKLKYKADYTEVWHREVQQPFSFFRWMFWSTSFNFSEAEEAAIRRHEETHIRRLHSVDILLIELVHVLMWFNPIIHFYKKSLQSIHEYEADQAALETSSYPKYGQILLQQLRGTRTPAFTQPFFTSMLKNRILMMKKNPSTRKELLRFLPAIPMVVLMLFVFSNKSITAKLEEPMQASLEWVKLEFMSFDEAFVRNALRERLEMEPNVTNAETGKPVSDYFKRTIRITNFQETYRRLVKTFPEHKETIDGIAIDIAAEYGYSVKMKGDTMVYKDLENDEMSEGAKRYVERRRILESRDEHSKEVSSFLRNLEVEELVKDTLPGTMKPVEEVDEIALISGCTEGTYEERQNCSLKAILNIVYSNIRYPESARKAGEEGAVVVQMHITETGAVKGAEVVQSVSKSLDEEALRIVSWIPTLQPAQKDGEAVASTLSLPIKFKLGPKATASATEEKKKQSPILPLKDQAIEDLSPDDIFKVVEEMPMFDGCGAEYGLDGQDLQECNRIKLLEYIYSNIKYPKEAKEAGIGGVVVARFVVDKSGEIRNAKIVRSLGGGTDEEVLRVVESMPTWIPGKQRGVPVNVEFNLPIKFKIDPNIPIPDVKETTEEAFQWDVYPNPATEYVNVEFDIPEKVEGAIKLFNAKGEMVYEDQLGLLDYKKMMQVVYFPDYITPGVYMLQLTLGDRIQTKQVIIQPKD